MYIYIYNIYIYIIYICIYNIYNKNADLDLDHKILSMTTS